MTSILGRPLTFGDAEQIEYLRKEGIKSKAIADVEINKLTSQYLDKENEIEELEEKKEDIYHQLTEIAIQKYGIKREDVYLLI